MEIKIAPVFLEREKRYTLDITGYYSVNFAAVILEITPNEYLSLFAGIDYEYRKMQDLVYFINIENAEKAKEKLESFILIKKLKG